MTLVVVLLIWVLVVQIAAVALLWRVLVVLARRQTPDISQPSRAMQTMLSTHVAGRNGMP